MKMKNFKQVEGIRKYRLTGLLFIFFILNLGVQAQQIIITGKVSDIKTGEPLPDVSVFARGARKGTKTNIDGKYELMLSSHVSEIQTRRVNYLACTKKSDIFPGQTINIKLIPHDFYNRARVLLPGEYYHVVDFGNPIGPIRDRPLEDYLRTKSPPNIRRR